jgi:hypothetical protein
MKDTRRREKRGHHGRKRKRSAGMPRLSSRVLVVILDQASTKLALRDDDG